MTFVKTKPTRRERSERFETAFNRIHLRLKKLVPQKNENFLFLLNIAKEKHTTIDHSL